MADIFLWPAAIVGKPLSSLALVVHSDLCDKQYKPESTLPMTLAQAVNCHNTCTVVLPQLQLSVCVLHVKSYPVACLVPLASQYACLIGASIS